MRVDVGDPWLNVEFWKSLRPEAITTKNAHLKLCFSLCGGWITPPLCVTLIFYAVFMRKVFYLKDRSVRSFRFCDYMTFGFRLFLFISKYQVDLNISIFSSYVPYKAQSKYNISCVQFLPVRIKMYSADAPKINFLPNLARDMI